MLQDQDRFLLPVGRGPGPEVSVHRCVPEPGPGGLDRHQRGPAAARRPAAVEEPAGSGHRAPPEPLDRVRPAGHEEDGHPRGPQAERRRDGVPRPREPQPDLLRLQAGVRPAEEPEGRDRGSEAGQPGAGRPGHGQIRHFTQRTPQDLRYTTSPRKHCSRTGNEVR